MIRRVWINRRTGVMHRSRFCRALDIVPDEMLREETFDPERPRRRCSRCWPNDDAGCVDAGTPPRAKGFSPECRICHLSAGESGELAAGSAQGFPSPSGTRPTDASGPAKFLAPAGPLGLFGGTSSADRPRRSASAGAAAFVTERSEGNPSGLTGADGPATPATQRAGRATSRVGGLVTPPKA